jgi:predicted exporter
VTSAVARLLLWSRRHRRLLAGLAAAIVLASAAGMRRLSFDTDVLSLLPRDGRVIPAFRTFLADFGSLDQLYVIFEAPAGHAIGEYEDQVDGWVASLRQAPEILRVDSGLVDNSRDFGWLADRQLLLFPDKALAAALSRFQPERMREALAGRRELLSVPSPAVAQLVRQDPLGFFDLMREQLGGAQAGLNVGVTEGGYVSKDGRSRLVIAQPVRPPYDAAFSRALMDRLETIRTTLTQPAAEAGRRAAPHEEDDEEEDDADEPLPPMTVSFAGGHRIAVETEALVRRESVSNTTGSLLLILPLLFLVFRSLWLVLVGPLPSAIGLVAVLGLLGLAGATLSAAATASAAMLFGLGVDGVVLLYVAYTHARQDGLEPDAAVGSLAGSSYSMLLGMWTTAATFYGLAFVDFPSLEQLGWLIGHSMVACGVLTLVLVPAFLPSAPVRRRALAMPRLAAWVTRRRMPALVAAAIVTVLLGGAATRLRINPTLERLRSVTPGARLAAQVAPMFGLPEDVYVVLAEGPDLQPLLRENERLAAQLVAKAPGIGLQPATALLPSDDTQAARARDIAGAHLSGDVVSARLEQAAADEGFRPATFAPFAERLPRVLDVRQRLTYDGYMEHGLGDLLDRFVARTSTGWATATYLFPADDAQLAAAQRVVEEVQPDATVTGMPLVNRELAARFLPQFLRGLGIGSVIVLAIVILAFRDWWLSLLALLPTAIGLIWAAGLLAIAGVDLDLFALFAVVTFVGIGVDYGIHLVERYRERGEAQRAIAELAPVILVAAGITVFGYGTLVTSSYPPLRSIGMVSAVSVSALTVTSVIVLPALLAGSAGRGARSKEP